MAQHRDRGGTQHPFAKAAILGVLSAALVLTVTVVGILPQTGSAQTESPNETEVGGLSFRLGLPAYVEGDPPMSSRVMYKDSLISINNQCPVRKGRLDPNRAPVYVNGQPVGFCCQPCPATFSFDPEKYLRAMNVTLRCPVRPARRAILDSSLRTTLNQDIFFFSSVAALKQFKKDPLRYIGSLTDPVSQERFKPSKSSPHVTFRGREYYFGSDSTLVKFQTQPDRFFERQAGT